MTLIEWQLKSRNKCLNSTPSENRTRNHNFVVGTFKIREISRVSRVIYENVHTWVALLLSENNEIEHNKFNSVQREASLIKDQSTQCQLFRLIKIPQVIVRLCFPGLVSPEEASQGRVDQPDFKQIEGS